MALPRCKSTRRPAQPRGVEPTSHHEYAPRWGDPVRHMLTPGRAQPRNNRLGVGGVNALG
eukprot:5338179-Lingulodinium_polyedra.AAC.1